MEFLEQMKEKVKEIEQMIEQFLPKEEGYQQLIFEAMNYSVRAGGKRLRPMLMLETYRLFGGEDKVIEPYMAAIEMIHTYSLVHDDLPAMDDDLYRRGKKTTHAVYGEAMGILAGDALLNYAYETIANAMVTYAGTKEMGRAFFVLAKNAGVYGMVGGQVVDVLSEGEEAIERDKLDVIYRLKTGALIETSMVVGAILAGADEKQQELIRNVAQKIGLAFQIQDDILDCTSTLEILGKPIGSDEKNHKVTYVTFEGLEASKKDVERLTKEAMELLDTLPVTNDFLKELLNYLVHREK